MTNEKRKTNGKTKSSWPIKNIVSMQEVDPTPQIVVVLIGSRIMSPPPISSEIFSTLFFVNMS